MSKETKEERQKRRKARRARLQPLLDRLSESLAEDASPTLERRATDVANLIAQTLSKEPRQ